MDLCFSLTVPHVVASPSALPEQRIFHWGSAVISEPPTYWKVGDEKLAVIAPVNPFGVFPPGLIDETWIRINIGTISDKLQRFILNCGDETDTVVSNNILNFIKNQIDGNLKWCIEFSWSCDRADKKIAGSYQDFIELLKLNFDAKSNKEGFVIYKI